MKWLTVSEHGKDNPSAAEKVVSGIYDKAQFLSDFPQLGHKYREEQEGDIRVLLYGHYRIAYIITSDYIDILGVFHGAPDYTLQEPCIM